MSWTTEQKIKSLMRLPWTVTSERADDPDEFIVRVKELPGTVVIGTKAEIDAEFWNALRASIEANLEFGDPFELPPNVQCVPWEAAPPKTWLERVIVKRGADSFTALSQPVAMA